MNIVTREQWGARHATTQAIKRPVLRVVIHHSYLPDIPAGTAAGAVVMAIRGIERHHVETKGWQAIGYNWLIDQDGRIYEGRGWGKVGAHAAGVNSVSVGICFLIDGQVRAPSTAAWTAAISLIGDGIRRGEIEPTYILTGHRDHAQTTCPGNKVVEGMDRLRVIVPPREPRAPEVVRPAPPTPAIRLDRIVSPTQRHVDEIARVRRLTPEEIAAGLEVAEILMRGVIAARGGDLRELAIKAAADAVADWIKSQRKGAA